MMDNLFMSPNESFSLPSFRETDPSKHSDISDLAEPDERGQQILIMNVELRNGQIEEILVHEREEPEVLAEAFCLKHSLPSQICQALSNQIEANIEQLVEEELNFTDEAYYRLHRPVYETPPKSDTSASFYRQTFDQLNAEIHGKYGSFTERPSYSHKPLKKKLAKAEGGKVPVGHRLYHKGMMKIKALEHAVKTKLKERLEKEVEGLTFTPKTLKRIGTETRLLGSQSAGVMSRLKLKENKIKKMQEEKQFQELIDCTFRPEISEGTRELTKSRTHTPVERTEFLYKEAKVLEAKRKADELRSIKGLPFKPEIHESPKKTSEVRTITSVRLSRQSSPLKSVANVDDLGCTFQPKIGRSPKLTRRSVEMPIGAFLHSQKLKRDSPVRRSLPVKLTGEKSLKIIDKLRFERYFEIYKAFCKEGTDEVEWHTSRLALLGSSLIRVLSPFIEELEKSGQVYDQSKFSDELEKFAKKLSPIDKSTLYGTSKPDLRPEMPSFKPKITDYTSEKLRKRASLSLRERLLKEQAKTRAKLNEIKVKLIEDEMSECTFYPNTLELRKSLQVKSSSELNSPS
jgi:hypothetical protein